MSRQGGPRVDLTGKKYGRLTVVSVSHRDKHREYHWLCKCECGTEKVLKMDDFKNGETRSCGCLQLEITRDSRVRMEMLIKESNARNEGRAALSRVPLEKTMEIHEYELALDDLLRDAEKAGGVISISDMWNAAINAAIEHIEGSAFANKACAEDQSADNDAGDIDRLNMRSKFGYEMAARIRELLVPNAKLTGPARGE